MHKLIPLIAALLLSCPTLAAGQEVLRWGCDPTGGAPFVTRDADQKYSGFEVDLAAYLAKQMGREPKMVAADWDKLPELLKVPVNNSDQSIDIVLNGYEYKPDLAKQFASSRPYYIYRLALLGRASDNEVRGWADLYRPRAGGRHKTVGVLGGTVCQQYVEKTFGDSVELLSNPDVATVMKLVADGRIDATVQDNPAADYYAALDPRLRIVGEPVRPGFYVIYYRKKDVGLGEKLDKAIHAGIETGELRRIYEKYGVWNEDQERLDFWQSRVWPPVDVATNDDPKGKPETAPNRLLTLVGELALAALVTIKLAVVSFPLAVLIGLTVAVGRVYGPRWLGLPLGIYVEVVRGTPLLLQLFMIYYLLPQLLISTKIEWVVHLTAYLTPTAAGILGLAINYSAYEAENYRAGLVAVPKGQLEAAQSLGMTPWVAITRVVVPQAVRTVIPPVTNDFIALFKDTSACSIILVVELTRKYNELFNFNRDLIVQLAFITAGMYLLMSYPLAIVAGRLERRLGTGPPSPGAVS